MVLLNPLFTQAASSGLASPSVEVTPLNQLLSESTCKLQFGDQTCPPLQLRSRMTFKHFLPTTIIELVAGQPCTLHSSAFSPGAQHCSQAVVRGRLVCHLIYSLT
jgi:hypothetical protein